MDDTFPDTGDSAPSASTSSEDPSACEIRFRAVFPDARFDPSRSLDAMVKAECDAALLRHEQAAGFAFAAITRPDHGKKVRPLEDTFRESLHRSKEVPPADE